jgi:hypothetical protein
MTDETANARSPKRRRRVKWVAGAILFLILLFVYQLFGPNPAIIVSRETTYITKPLGPDGLPDYRQAMLEMYREGVTPENNAAVLLWQVLGRGKLDPAEYEAICKEIGLSPPPGEDAVLEQLDSEIHRKRIERWLTALGYAEDVSWTYELEEAPLNQPWNSSDFPPFAEWVVKNQEPINLIVEASQRSRFYSPSPSLIGVSAEPPFMMLSPGVDKTLHLRDCLITRAMWHLGEERLDESWADLLAVHRLARLVSQSHSFIEQLRAVSISDLACDATIVLLYHGDLTSDQARKIRDDLAALPDFDFAVKILNKGERLAFLDLVVKFSSPEKVKLARDAVRFTAFGFVDSIAVDWNVVLVKANNYFDSLAIAARNPEHAARRQAIARIDAEREQSTDDVKRSARLLSALCTKKGRGRSMADILLEIFASALPRAIEVEDRANLTLQLTRLSADLAFYRSNHGEYPIALSTLQPSISEELITDPHSNKPFIYKRDEQGMGYVLYSVFINGEDDGGTDIRGEIVEGEWVSEEQQVAYGTESDLVVRAPRPAFKLPKTTAPAAEP